MNTAHSVEQVNRIKRKLKEMNKQLNTLATDETIEKFEKEQGVSLPLDYRLFIQTIGNGGSGPFYGFHELKSSFVDTVSNEKAANGHGVVLDGKILTISHEGCGIYHVLSLEGEQSGSIWEDARVNDAGFLKLGYGFYPYQVDYRIMNWYETWLDSGAMEMKDMRIKLQD